MLFWPMSCTVHGRLSTAAELPERARVKGVFAAVETEVVTEGALLFVPAEVFSAKATAPLALLVLVALLLLLAVVVPRSVDFSFFPVSDNDIVLSLPASEEPMPPVLLGC